MEPFLTTYVWPTLFIVAQILAIILPLLGAVAYLTLAERKVIASQGTECGRAIWAAAASG